MTPPTIRFARAAQTLSAAARAAGLAVPTFCSPPRHRSAVRTLRRRADGHVVVAVRIRDRAFDDVLRDMVDGVCAANALRGSAATRIQAVLRDALGVSGPVPPLDPSAPIPSSSAVASRPPARMAERHTQAA